MKLATRELTRPRPVYPSTSFWTTAEREGFTALCQSMSDRMNTSPQAAKVHGLSHLGWGSAFGTSAVQPIAWWVA